MRDVLREMGNPRAVALNCLVELEKGGIVQEIVDRNLEKAALNNLDRKLLTDLVFGVLRNYSRLEFILRSLLPAPDKLPARLFKLLLLGLYSLFFQEKVPHYATVNESVKIAASLFGAKMGKLANAVLRRAQILGDAPDKLEWYAEKLPAWEAQCVFYGIPQAIASMWRQAYGAEKATLLMRRSAGRPWAALRFNASRKEARELCDSLAPGPGREKLAPFAWAFAPGQMPDLIGGRSISCLEREGLVSRQSPASILICEKLGIYEWREPIWDCCAGSGIKLAALLERGVPARLASDISARRLANIRPFCARLGLGAPALLMAAAEQPPLSRWQGNILADLPCSGLGTLARRPDIRIRFLKSAASLKEHALRQKRILKAIAATLAPGGKLAYLTCTLNPAENEEQVATLMPSFPDLRLRAEWQTPHEHPWLEGMYGAVLEKR